MVLLQITENGRLDHFRDWLFVPAAGQFGMTTLKEVVVSGVI
jgi:hypothetical protein